MNEFTAQRTGRGARRWPRAIALLALLIPAVPIVAGLAIRFRTAGARAHNGAGLTPVAQSPGTRAPSRAFPVEHGELVAFVTHATTMRVSAGGRSLARLPVRSTFGSPEAMWVVRRSPGWLGVISPLAGNGRVGWIPDSAAQLTRVRWELKVSLSARRLTVLESGRVLARYPVAIGRPDAPTPTGRFDVTDRLATGDPSGPYGCCILALSAVAPHAIQGWKGGNRVAIHSTPETSSIGQPVSHGCIRLTLAQGRWLLRHIPLGTPTLISG